MTPREPLIRDAREAELPDLVEVQRRASLIWDAYREQLEANPGVIAIPVDQVRAGHVRVAAGEDDRPLGFSAVVRISAHTVELDGLYVEPEHMRRGIGALLVADVAERARAAGAQRVEVTANPGAVAFYERNGFRETGTAATLFGPAPRMTLALTPPELGATPAPARDT